MTESEWGKRSPAIRWLSKVPLAVKMIGIISGVLLHVHVSLFVLLTAAFFSSCRPPLGDPKPRADGPDTAKLEVSFSSTPAFSKASGASRTVMPSSDLGITSITVTVTDAADGVLGTGGVDSVSEICVIGQLTPGAVTVAAEAFDGGTRVAGGSTTVSLVAGGTLSVTVPLTPGDSGEGGYILAVRWPKATNAGYAEYYREGGEPIPADVDDESDPDEYLCVCGETDVPAGSYNLFIAFYDNSEDRTVLGAFAEAVNVYAGLESDTWLDGEGEHRSERLFTEEELKSSLTQLFRLEVRGADFSNSFSNPVADGAPGWVPIEIGKSASPYLSFTPVLPADAGQRITYAWNVPLDPDTDVQIGSGAGSGPLDLSDNEPIENGVNALTVTVSPEVGESATYTVTVVKAYRISYDGNGSTGGDVPADALYYAGEEVTAAELEDEEEDRELLVREGWSFVEWNTEPGGSGTGYKPGDSFEMDAVPLTLYAQWIENGTVGISFSLPEYRSLVFRYDGEPVRTLTVTRDEENPLVIGYGGAGTEEDWAWYLDGALDEEATSGSYSFDRSVNGRFVVSCAVTYDDTDDGVENGVRYSGTLAVTVVDEFSLAYDGNGAESGTVPSGCTFSTEDTVIVSGNTGVPPLSRSGYAWAGWSPDHLAVVPRYTGTEQLDTGAGSVTLYAVWENTAPGQVSNLIAVSTEDSIALSWEAPADRDFAEVVITGVSHGFPETTVRKGVYRKVYTGLLTNTTYTFSVGAYDSAGNASEGKLIGAYTAAADDYPPETGYSISVPDGTLNFDVDAGGNVTITGVSTMTDLVIPASIGGHPVTNLGDALLGWREDIVSVVLPDSITSIARQAFDGCYNLHSVNIPPFITSIGFHAFVNCWYLTDVTIPATVGYIGGGAFCNCMGLTTVNIFAMTPPEIGTPDPEIFACDAVHPSHLSAIYVPSASLAEYQSADGWKYYADKIRAGSW